MKYKRLNTILVNNTLLYYNKITKSYIDNTKILWYNANCKGKTRFYIVTILLKKRGFYNMSYLGIYTNDINNFDLSEHKKAKTIEELEEKQTSKCYLKIFKLIDDTLEDAELVCTKVLK